MHSILHAQNSLQQTHICVLYTCIQCTCMYMRTWYQDKLLQTNTCVYWIYAFNVHAYFVCRESVAFNSIVCYCTHAKIVCVYRCVPYKPKRPLQEMFQIYAKDEKAPGQSSNILRVYVRMCVCKFVYMHVRAYVCISHDASLRMHVCMLCEFMYVCTCEYVYIIQCRPYNIPRVYVC